VLTPRQYLFVLRRSWAVLLAGVLLGSAAGATWTLLRAPSYEASAQVYVSTRQASSLTDLNQGASYAQQAATNYATIAMSPILLDRVAKSLRSGPSSQDIASNLSVSAEPSTSVLDIRASASTPRTAAAIANAVATQLNTVVSELTAPDSDGLAPVKLSVIASALPPAQPKLSLWTPIAVGAFIGLLVALAITVLRVNLDNRIRTAESLVELTDIPLLGAIPFDEGAASAPITGEGEQMDHARATRAEAYRTLRANVQFVSLSRQSSIFTTTSSVPFEGKTTTTSNLAATIARTGKRVLLVDADLRRPRIADYLAIDGSVGLVDVLASRATFDQAVQEWGDDRLAVLPAGPIPPNPSELLQSENMRALLAQLRSSFDYILIDTPPVLLASDAAVLSRLSDGAILVVGSGICRKRELPESAQSIERAGGALVGVVLNKQPVDRRQTYYSYE
jgi:succinoglycan biosynthesis transport protein ExoP